MRALNELGHKLLIWLGALAFVLAAAASPALAEKRIALVIGNSSYRGGVFGPLKNPVNDARLMAATLKAAPLNFDVVLLTDATRDQMETAIKNLGGRLNAAGKDSVGLFYFAGHGVQSQGRNYLIPANGSASTEQDVWAQAPRMGLVEQFMGFAGNRVNFIIVDACRTNNLPVAMRGNARTASLRESDAEGLLIGYSSQPGAPASDGAGANSPYTTALAAEITTRGIIAEQVFKRVTARVLKASEGKQRPWIEGGLSGEDFCFAGCGAAAATEPQRDTRIASSGADSVGRSAGAAAPSVPAPAGARPPPPPAGGGGLAPAAKSSTTNVGEVSAQPTEGAAAAFAAARSGAPVAQRGFRDRLSGGGLGPEMVALPAGSFTMGSPASEAGRFDLEGPQRRVTIGYQFAVGKYEVTWDEYSACATAGGCKAAKDDGFGKGSRPVTNVSWDHAKAYAKWLSVKTGQSYRLLSEAEWEYAARAGTTTAYPWGDAIGKGNAACDGCGSQWDYKSTAPVGSFKPNAFGLYDMHGNVWQWVEDPWHESYKGAPVDGSVWTTGGDASQRVLRGGSWDNSPQTLRSAYRDWDVSTARSNGFGFRLARTLPR